MAYGHRCGVITSGHLFVACMISTLAWSWRPLMHLSALPFWWCALTSTVCDPLLLVLGIICKRIVGKPSVISMVLLYHYSMGSCKFFKSIIGLGEFPHWSGPFACRQKKGLSKDWRMLLLPCISLSLGSPSLGQWNPFIVDLNVSKEMHLPGMLISFICNDVVFPLHGVCVAFPNMQAAHIGVSWFDSLTSLLGSMFCSAINHSLLKGMWLSLMCHRMISSLESYALSVRASGSCLVWALSMPVLKLKGDIGSISVMSMYSWVSSSNSMSFAAFGLLVIAMLGCMCCSWPWTCWIFRNLVRSLWITIAPWV